MSQQLVPNRVQPVEAVDVPKNEKEPLSKSVAHLFMDVYKFLLSDCPEAKRLRAEYYPIIKADAASKATTEVEDVEVKEYISLEKQMPTLKMAKFKGDDADSYAYTSKHQEVVFNRYLCDAYDNAIAKQNPQLDVLKYIVLLTIYHELAHVFINEKTPRDMCYQKIIQDITGIPEAMRLPDENGEAGFFLEYNITGGLIDTVWPERDAAEDDSKYSERKYMDAQGIRLRKYEKNAKDGSLECKIYEIKPDALKRHVASTALGPFREEDMVLTDTYNHYYTIEFKEIALDKENLTRNEK